MNRVLTPAACAWATIAAMLPPSDLLRYQIHMPWPSKGLPATATLLAGAGSTFGGVGRVQRVVVHVDRAVGARVAPAAEQDHDVPGVGRLWNGHEQTVPGLARNRVARVCRRLRPR